MTTTDIFKSSLQEQKNDTHANTHTRSDTLRRAIHKHTLCAVHLHAVRHCTKKIKGLGRGQQNQWRLPGPAFVRYPVTLSKVRALKHTPTPCTSCVQLHRIHDFEDGCGAAVIYSSTGKESKIRLLH